MKNVLTFEDFDYNYGVDQPRIICRPINESNDIFNEDINKIIKISNQNILVINDIPFSEKLSEKNKVFCIYFDKKLKPVSSNNLTYYYVKLKRKGTTIHEDTIEELKNTFEELKDIEFSFVFNFSPSLNFEVVSDLNLYLFDKSFTPGITAFYSFDEFDVVYKFDADLYKIYKIKTHGKKKIDSSTWVKYGFNQENSQERYLTDIYVQEDDILFREDLDETDNMGATSEITDDRTLIKGMIEPKIYAFRSDLIDNAVGSPTIKVGDTDRGVPVRMEEWKKKAFNDLKLLGEWSAVVSGCGEGLDGKIFRDKSVHKFINKPHVEKSDWNSNLYYSNELFSDCKSEDAVNVVSGAIEKLKDAFIDGRLDVVSKLKDKKGSEKSSFIYPTHSKTLPYKPRELQQQVIDKFRNRFIEDATDMLIYAVMRFGKTFVACECVREYCGNTNGGNFILVVSAKVDVKDEWIGSINPWSNYSNIDMYDASFDEGGLITMLQDDRKWIDEDKTIPGPHPGVKYNDLEGYFKDHPDKNIMVFASLQDLNGDIRDKVKRDKDGNVIEVTEAEIKARHTCFYEYPINMLIVDESHFGSQSKKLGEQIIEGDNKDVVRKKSNATKEIEKEQKEEKEKIKEGMEDIIPKLKIIKPGEGKHPTVKLHLSGTPYKLMQMGRFEKENVIANFGFADLMEAKNEWIEENSPKSDEWIEENKRKKEAGEQYENDNKNPYSPDKNPYYGIPEMIQFGYNFEDFDLEDLDGKYDFATLFETVSQNGKKVFKYEADILMMFAAIDGSTKNDNVLSLLDLPEIKRGNMCKNIIMVLPYKECCDVMERFLRKYKNDLKNLGTYRIINIAGKTTDLDTPTGKRLINDEVYRGNKTISLTVDKMLTGVTVKPWDTMFYMKDCKSAQEYDQARFRIQSPYVKEIPEIEIGDDLKTVHETGEKIKVDMKPQTIFVDFCANRIFTMLYDRYAAEMKVSGKDTDRTSVYIRESLKKEYNCLPIVINEMGKLKRVESNNIMDKIADAEVKELFTKTADKLIKSMKWPEPNDDEVENIIDFSMGYDRKSKKNIIMNAHTGDTSSLETSSKTPLVATNTDDDSVPSDHKSTRKKSRDEMTAEEIEQENLEFATRCDTILRNIGIYLVVKKNDQKVDDFHDFFYQTMRTDPGYEYNLQTIINVFGDGIIPDTIEKQREKANKLRDKLLRWKNGYLAKNNLVFEVEKRIVVLSRRFGEGEVRKDYNQIRGTLEEFGNGYLSKGEYIMKDDLTKELFKDVVIFNKDTTILDCYGSKMGEIAYWLYTNDKFKDNFSLDNYYLIVKEGLFSELSKVTLGLIYDKVKKKLNIDGNRNKSTVKDAYLNKHILIFNSTKENFDIPKKEDEELTEGRKPSQKAILDKYKIYLDDAIKKKWGENMKFDIIVGNPPYKGTLHYKLLDTIKNTVCNNNSKISWISPDIFADYMKIKEYPKGLEGLVNIKHFNNKDASNLFGSNIQISNGLSIAYYDFSSNDTLSIDDISIIEKWPIEGIHFANNVKSNIKVSLKDKIETYNNQKYFCPITIMQKVDGGSNRANIICDIGVLIDGCIDGVNYKKIRKNGGRSDEDRELYGFSFNTYKEAENCFNSFKLDFYQTYVSLIHLHSRYVLKDYPYLENYNIEWTDDKLISYFNIDDRSKKYIITKINNNDSSEETCGHEDYEEKKNKKDNDSDDDGGDTYFDYRRSQEEW